MMLVIVIATLLIDCTALPSHRVRRDAVVCPGDKSGRYANPSDCSSYIECLYVGSTWEQAYKLDCPAGLHYDADSQACNWPNLVDCKIMVVTDEPEDEDYGGCPGGTSGRYANPSDCASYIECQHMGTLNQRVDTMNCPPSLLYDPDTDRCDWPQNVNCQVGEQTQTTSTSGRSDQPMSTVGGDIWTDNVITTDGDDSEAADMTTNSGLQSSPSTTDVDTVTTTVFTTAPSPTTATTIDETTTTTTIVAETSTAAGDLQSSPSPTHADTVVTTAAPSVQAATTEVFKTPDELEDLWSYIEDLYGIIFGS